MKNKIEGDFVKRKIRFSLACFPARIKQLLKPFTIELRRIAKRLGVILAVLNRASEIRDMDLPGFRLHPLKGRRTGTLSVWISGNWRVTFRFENGEAFDVNLEDYH